MSQNSYEGIEAVVFDLDGTLIDSVPDIAAAVNAALAAVRLPGLAAGEIRRMVGRGARHLIDKAVAAVSHGKHPPASVDTIYAAFLAAYEAAPCARTQLYPGTLELLDNLQRHGLRLGVCTNKPQAITDRVLAALGIRHRFAAVVGGRDGVPLKPAPDMLRSTLSVLAARPRASVMVGDSEADSGAARAAGTRLVLVEHGYGQVPLTTLGADALVPGFGDLPEALMRMTR